MAGKTKQKSFRMEEETFQLLELQAKEYGFKNQSEYLRYLVQPNRKNNLPLTKELGKLRKEINAIGININQIVKNHNSFLYKNSDKESLFTDLQDIQSLILTLISKF